jgi:hypothetical protein
MSETVIDLILNNKFLPVREWNKSGHFNGYDSKELFEKHLESQPDDWYYRYNTVNYTLNTRRYRTSEFNTIDWCNSVVLLGCSNVFGTALDDNDTISSQLAKLINKPVINLGVAASSIQYSVYNSIILSSGYPTPLAVVQLWTGYDRCMLFDNVFIENFGSWNMEPGNYMDLWNKNTNSIASALMFREISKQLWINKTIYYEASSFKSTTDIFHNCVHLPVIDYARDLMHPGIKTVALIAEHIAEKIKL